MTKPWTLVAVLWVVGLLNYVDRQVIFSLFPLLEKDIGLTAAQFGLLSTVFLWTYGVLSPIAGYVADRFGRGRAVIASLLVWSAVTWATGHARSFEQLLVARGLMGISEACYLPAALALIAHHHGDRTRSLATGLHQSGLYAGVIAGGAIGGWLGEHYGWHVPFLLLGGIGIVYSAIVSLSVRKDRPVAEGATTRPLFNSLGQVFRLPGYGRLLLVFSVFGLANWLVYTWLPLYLYERFHVSLGEAGFSATFYVQVASFAGIFVGGIAADRWAVRNGRGRVIVQAIGLGAAAPFLFLAAWTSSLAVLIAALIFFGLGRGMYDSNTMPVLCLTAPEHLRSTGYGIFNLFACIVGGITTALVGKLKSAIGLAGAFHLAAILLGLAALVLLTFRRERGRPVVTL